MSSSNLVRIIGIPEASYGVTPPLDASIEVLPLRFVSESLTGTPQTAESAEARNDRMSGGQVVVGLTSGGDINGELSQSDSMDKLIEMALMGSWQDALGPVAAAQAVLTKDPGNDQLATLAVTGLDVDDVDGAGNGYVVGDVLNLSGFVNPANNGPRQIVSLTPPGTMKVVVPRAAVNETAPAVTVSRPGYVDLGSEVHSLTLSKSYEDVTHLATTDVHSQRYTGALVNQLSMQLAWGQIATQTATFVANGYVQEVPSLAQQVEAGGGTIPPAATDQPLNGSVDMPMVTVDGQPTDYCIQSLNFTLNNNLSPQTCLGKIAPTKYSLGTAAISVQTSIYLGDQSYDAFMPAKLSQVPISLMFAAVNQDGGYAVELRAVQLSFPDPASAGRDQQTMITAEGVAKVGPDGTSAIRVYRL
jgi:hypothetical protein